MTEIKTCVISKCWHGCGEARSLTDGLWEWKMATPMLLLNLGCAPEAPCSKELVPNRSCRGFSSHWRCPQRGKWDMVHPIPVCQLPDTKCAALLPHTSYCDELPPTWSNRINPSWEEPPNTTSQGNSSPLRFSGLSSCHAKLTSLCRMLCCFIIMLKSQQEYVGTPGI